MKKILNGITISLLIVLILLALFLILKNKVGKEQYQTQVATNTMEENRNNTADVANELQPENNTMQATNPTSSKETENKTNTSSSSKKQTEKKNTSVTPQNENTTTSSKTSKQETKTEAVFTSSKIPDSILKKMIGNSIPTKSKDQVNTDNLSYLKITYWGFDSKTHVGEMVVHKKLAQEVLAIFKEVYEKKYPIEKMKLVDDYGADDEKSMRDNNTSAFCYRVVANTNTLSNHSKGTAIDINPLYNPYVVGNYISPTTGKKYANRTLNVKGMIQKGDALYNAFIKRGWTWGGSWSSKKDYQHFEKKI